MIQFLGLLGVNNIIKKDLDNMKQLITRNDENMSDLIRHLQDKGYHVSYRVDEENRVNSIFFIQNNAVEELCRFPEAVVLDTIYTPTSRK